jgi:hypothetical protein
VALGRKQERRLDTLAHFTQTALGAGLPIFELRRSNAQQIHRLMAGVYGDLVYHHGAGARGAPQYRIIFWDERASAERWRANRDVRDLAAELLFEHGEPFLGWLRHGPEPAADPAPRLHLVLGMHRSGTSCLTGCLERCGLHLGDVSRENAFNRKGNHELAEVIRLNDAILEANGGAWDAPPARIEATPEQRRRMREVVSGLRGAGPSGLKDPRALLVADLWCEEAGPVAAVGSFRHPGEVAASLARRQAIPRERALELWRHYNGELVRMHRTSPFPLVRFDLSDVGAYRRSILAVAFDLGLRPDVDALGRFVSPEMAEGEARAEPVPAECAELWHYLRSHEVDPDADGNPLRASVVRAWDVQCAAPEPPPSARERRRRSPARRFGRRIRDWLRPASRA